MLLHTRKKAGGGRNEYGKKEYRETQKEREREGVSKEGNHLQRAEMSYDNHVNTS